MLLFNIYWDIFNKQVPQATASSLGGLISIKFFRVKWRSLQRWNWLVSIKLMWFRMTSRCRKIAFLKRDKAVGVFA